MASTPELPDLDFFFEDLDKSLEGVQHPQDDPTQHPNSVSSQYPLAPGLQHPVAGVQHPISTSSQHPVAPGTQHPNVGVQHPAPAIKRVRPDMFEGEPPSSKRSKTITMEEAKKQYTLIKNKDNKYFATYHAILIAQTCAQFREQGVTANPIAIGQMIAQWVKDHDLKKWCKTLHTNYVRDNWPHYKIRKALMEKPVDNGGPAPLDNGGPAPLEPPSNSEAHIRRVVAMVLANYPKLPAF